MKEIDLASWQSECADNLPITALVIPGTHDTMTAPCTDRYYRTQHLTLAEQLRAGVRFLDIRLRQTMIAAHREWISDQSAEQIFETVREFLEENPSEFVLMRIQNANENKDDFPEYGKALHVEIEKHKELFYQWQDPDNSNPDWVTVGECRGKIIPLECAPLEFEINRIDGRVWAANWHENPNVRIQDLWDGPSPVAKMQAIAQGATQSSSKELVLNHISATNGELGFPDAYADIMNPFTSELWETGSAEAENVSGEIVGVQIYDFIDDDLSRSVVALNFDN